MKQAFILFLRILEFNMSSVEKQVKFNLDHYKIEEMVINDMEIWTENMSRRKIEIKKDTEETKAYLVGTIYNVLF